MNYYDAREKLDKNQRPTGRWDYTCKNDNRIWPVGYCAGWKEPKPDELVVRFGDATAQSIVDDLEKKRQFIHKFHTDGHATKEEAYECYRQYLLDTHLRFDLKMSDQKKRCEVPGCGEWTQDLAEVDHHIMVLCEKHKNRVEVEKLFTVGECISSY